MVIYYRQGDVAASKVEKLPKGSTKVLNEGKIILAYGEVTNHHHRFEDGGVALYEYEGDKYIKVEAKANLRHEEHDLITFEPGIYKVIQQREYSPEAIRKVTD